MYIKKLGLTNFRNHKNKKIMFDNALTVIQGPNGSGKTNILEAIHMLSTTKSFRAGYDRDTIHFDDDFTRIEGHTENTEDNYTLEMVITQSPRFKNASSKKVKVNKVAKSLQNFSGTFTSVLFSPENMVLLTGSPGARRKHMDSVLFQIDKKYKKAVSEYERAVRQRNKILEMIRDTGTGENFIDFWDEKVVELGQEIQGKRADMFESFLKEMPKHVQALGNNVTIDIEYKRSNIDKQTLEEHKEREIAAKTTLKGPHRDDYTIRMNNYDIGSFGSRGQQRAAILALKLSEIDFIEEKTGSRPVLLLDDIFSELDEKHRDAVENVVNMQQTIITSTEPVDKKDVFELRLT
jgi:DNA replication and repair protein RecF